MNFFDVNCSIGGWPFRSVPRNSAGEVRADLTGIGCVGACVVNNGAILYADTGAANRELYEAIAPHRDFFVGAATINPLWPRPEEELDRCCDRYGFRALRLLPLYWGCPCNHPAMLRLIRHAEERGLPILLPAEIVNLRQRNRLEPDLPLRWETAAELAKLFPRVRFLFLDSLLPPAAAEIPNLYGEFNRGRAAYGDNLARMVHALGSERVLLGTGAPLRIPNASLLKLAHTRLSDSEKLRIALENARTIFSSAMPQFD